MKDIAVGIVVLLVLAIVCYIGYDAGKVEGRRCRVVFASQRTAQDSLAAAVDGCGWLLEPAK